MTGAPSVSAITCKTISSSMIPKSCKIWMTGLPLRLNSACTSSNCKSSIRLCSLIRDSSGFVISSAISPKVFSVRCQGSVSFSHLAFADDDLGFGADGGGEFEFLELGLDGDGVLGLGDDLFAGDHALQIFINQKRIQGDHAVFRSSLNV